MSFTQLKRINEVDNTLDEAIESYGSFVKFMNKMKAAVIKSKRRDGHQHVPHGIVVLLPFL